MKSVRTTVNEVHADSSTPGADLLSITLTVDQENLDGDPPAVAARAKDWQEKVAAGVSQRLLSRQNSTARLGAALEVATGVICGAMTQETPSPLPCKTLAVLCCIALIDCINATILNPYVDDMVSMLLKTERGSPDVSLWVSVLVGSYSLCEVIFSAMWGMLADKLGRRPVLLVGLTGSAVAPIIFGMAGSLPVALGARLMDGFFCGNIGVVRTYLGELVDSSNEAKAFGILAATFSLGLIIGPTIGGSLAYPARWYPATFQGTIFDTHPFLLPNLSYACLAVAALLVGFFALPESRARVQQQQAALLEARSSGAAESESQPVKFWQGFPKGRNFRQILIASSLLNGYVAARLNAFVLVSSLPQKMGGMALSPHQFGYIQVCAAAMIFLNQATFYPVLLRRLGMHRCFALCLSWTIAISLPIPLYYMVADPRFHFWRYVPITAWQMLSQFGLATCFPVAVMLVNRECSVENRGSVNGWCNSLNALSRGLGPPLAGGLFRLGCYLESSSFQLGRYLPFYVNMITAVVCIRLVVAQSKTEPAETTAELPSA